MAIATTNPATGETLRTFDSLSDAELDAKLALADAAFRSFRRTGFRTRADILRRAADLLDAEVDDVAALLTTEMGKTITAARAEVKKCAVGMRWFAEHGASFLQPEQVGVVGEGTASVHYQPIGPVLAVMPWNFPLWQVTRFLAPCVMAGNVGLLKHASNVPQTSLFVEELLRRAGADDGVFQSLLIESSAVERVLRDDRVRAATLTGSTPAGASVASIAGSEIKKTVLELGGSDPFVVLPSADLEAAVGVAVTARCQNNGQSCIAAKRFIVHANVYDEFESRFVEAMAAQRVGDPMQDDTQVGPLATAQGRDDVEALLRDAVAKGATVLTGGERPDGPGWYFPPTVVTAITPEMDLYREEVFGPVAALYRVDDLDAAVALANDTPFGLGANIWTADEHEAEVFAREVDAGLVAVNGMVVSFPELPFGGIKTSGYGRELAAVGAREFTNIKTVWVKSP